MPLVTITRGREGWLSQETAGDATGGSEFDHPHNNKTSWAWWLVPIIRCQGGTQEDP